MSIRTEAESPPPWPVFALFVGSGCAALIYEVVWLQLLQLTLGSTAVSLAAVLAAFMGGLCLGSLALPRCVSPRRHPLRVYAALELGIAALGLALLFGLPAVDELYSRWTSPGPTDMLLRGLVAGLCLLPPAALMGATLPAVARSVPSDARGLSWLGWCYAGNIVGGMVGCLVAGYYLLRVTDMQTTAVVAAAINVTLAFVALALAPRRRHAPQEERSAEEAAGGAPRAMGVYLAIALSGGAALGGEVVWTRLLSLLLGGTVYTFSLILAVFLAGLGLGSSLGAVLVARGRSPRRALGMCQGLAILAVAWAAYWIAEAFPNWPIFPPLSRGPWYIFQLDLLRCLWALLPATCLWGASFPLALAAAGGRDPARAVGEITAANTLGAIAGALAFSLVLIPIIGTAGCQRVMLGLTAGAAVVALAPVVGRRAAIEPVSRPLRGAALVAVLVLAAGWLSWRLAPMPWRVVAYGRLSAGVDALSPQTLANNTWDAAQRNTDAKCLYLGEGRNVSVVVSQTRQGQRSFHGAGKIQASSLPLDMRLQRMLGHLPALAHPRPKSVLVVACGAGVTAGSFLVHPEVERIVVCDIEPLVPTRVAPYFSQENYQLADGVARENPRTVHGKQVEFVYDDGRHYLRTTSEKFDIITSDPIDPWVKGCAALNTTEYYEACRARLNPGGLISLWCPLYESDEATARSFIGTFFGVFSTGLVFSNDREGRGGYDVVLFGSAGPTTIDLDLIHRRLEQPEYQAVRESLRQVGWGLRRDPGVDLLSAYAGRAPDLTTWLRGAELNTDRNLRLQYLAGMSLNRGISDRILDEILACYRFPEGTFVGSPVRLRSLEQALVAAGRREP